MRNFLLCFILTIGLKQSYGCDMCGCSAGASQAGLLPYLQHSFIGIRYQQQQFKTQGHTTATEYNTSSTEKFYTGELWGRFVPFRRMQIIGLIPYQLNKQHQNNSTTSLNGIGDIQFVAISDILKSPPDNQKSISYLLQIGMGIKLPSGKSDYVKDGLMLHQNLQMGTGSIDFPLHLNGLIRHNKLGFQTEAQYRLNGKNKMHYAFGNQFNGNLKILYWKQAKKITILPGMGIQLDHRKADKQQDKPVDHTGGFGAYWQTSFDIYTKKSGFGVQFSKAIYQFYGEGLIENKFKLSTYYIYLIN
ncbi:MAG: hypothetical protein KA198_07835 [Chitinophagaceae bacterium]|nr:hypothetical protein [Chitinophagaceae bacterium]